MGRSRGHHSTIHSAHHSRCHQSPTQLVASSSEHREVSGGQFTLKFPNHWDVNRKLCKSIRIYPEDTTTVVV